VFWLSLLGGLGIIGGVVYLAMNGLLLISLPLMLAAVGLPMRAAHTVSVFRGHLRSLDRRHVSLPKATLHLSGEPDPRPHQA
jgi:hypothetical protein